MTVRRRAVQNMLDDLERVVGLCEMIRRIGLITAGEINQESGGIGVDHPPNSPRGRKIASLIRTNEGLENVKKQVRFMKVDIRKVFDE